MAILGKDKKKKESGSEDTAPSSEDSKQSADAKSQGSEEKSSESAPKKKSGAYYEVRAASKGGYRKAGISFGLDVQTLYVDDLTEEQCKMLDEANPKALMVKKYDK